MTPLPVYLIHSVTNSIKSSPNLRAAQFCSQSSRGHQWLPWCLNCTARLGAKPKARPHGSNRILSRNYCSTIHYSTYHHSLSRDWCFQFSTTSTEKHTPCQSCQLSDGAFPSCAQHTVGRVDGRNGAAQCIGLDSGSSTSMTAHDSMFRTSCHLPLHILQLE